ncbi:uncharacterized protein [Gossypium hirsutum]|uniref:Uncharacterized protein LOC107925488 n=2 Tax=Gossypium TaxID=3633 RepID=A0A1U8LEU5_GOSHI|nr:uncharacterized protein LOC107925488 [Gossypium hirsutum]XP_016711695.1 uncharacterized protein LOC107925488 [Gossypium hirsutum]
MQGGSSGIILESRLPICLSEFCRSYLRQLRCSRLYEPTPTAGLLKQSGSQQIQKDKTLPLEECLTLLGVQSSLTKREIWRLATSSLLHANIGRRMVNCYSLNSDGPTMENLSGPRRFLVVYFTSALSSNNS